MNGLSEIRLRAQFSSPTVSAVTIPAGSGTATDLGRNLLVCHGHEPYALLRDWHSVLLNRGLARRPTVAVILCVAGFVLPPPSPGTPANLNSLLLRQSRHRDPYLLGMLAANQRLSLLGAVPAGYHVRSVLWCIFPDRPRQPWYRRETGDSKSTASAHSMDTDSSTQAAGAFNFALCFPIWVVFLAQMLDAVDFPISVPVGDFSTIIPGKSQKMQDDEV